MISRQNRFHGHNSLRYVYSHGQVVRGPLCAIKYIDNPKRDKYRLAVVVSKKINKSAVVRNRIRRRLYEVFRLQQNDFIKPYDMVVTVFSDQIATIPHLELQKVVYSQLKQAGVLKKT